MIKPDQKTESSSNKIDLKNGLVGWWKFDECKGKVANDSSGKKRNGELKNFDSDTAHWVKGPVGNALRFNGKNDFVDVGDFEWGGACSFSGWVKYNKFQNYSRIFDFDGKGPVQFYLSNSSETNAFKLISRSQKKYINGFSIDDFFVAGTWQHLAFSLDLNGNLNTFSQGKISKAKSIVPVPKAMRDRQYFGKSQSSNDGYLNGALDDLRIYNRAITEAEVKALHAMGEASK